MADQAPPPPAPSDPTGGKPMPLDDPDKKDGGKPMPLDEPTS